MSKIKLKKFKSITILINFVLLLMICSNSIANTDNSDTSNIKSNVVQPMKTILNKGDYVYFGKYAGEPILWQAINIDSKQDVLLWSDKIITIKAFEATGILIDNRGNSERKRVGSNFWQKSSLRDWLNSDAKQVSFTHQPPDDKHIWKGINSYENESGFLYNFTPADQKLIVPLTHKSILAQCDSVIKSGGTEYFEVHGSRNPTIGVSNYDNAYYHWVTDKVFILDIKEVSKHVTKNGFTHKKMLTESAVNQSEFKADYLYPNNYYSYWIRTPVGNSTSTLLRVTDLGVVGDAAIDNRNFGVVPAIYINPGYSIISGKGSNSSPYVIYMDGNNSENYQTEVNQMIKKQISANSSNITNNANGNKNLNTNKAPTTKTSLLQPVLKWANGGTYKYWCENSAYSTPAIADIDNNGSLEIIGSAYSIVNLDAKTGKLNWRIGSGHDMNEKVKDKNYVGRTIPDVIIDDVDSDGKQEFVTAHDEGYVSVYDNKGYFKPGWPQKPINREFRAMKVCDLDLDGKKEIIASAAGASAQNTWVFDYKGNIRKGWPQLDKTHSVSAREKSGLPVSKSDTGRAWGVFSNSISTGDVDMDGYPDIIVPSDMRFVCAYDRNGNLLPANPIFDGKNWGLIGFWESFKTELKQENEGWGFAKDLTFPREERYTTNFSRSGSVVTDIDGNGKNEVIVSGYVFDTCAGMPPSIYTTVYILNADRTRFNNGTYNWEEAPKDVGKPLVEDYNFISDSTPIPVVADIDKNGVNDILFSSFDGKVHCFSLDKKEKNSWPFSVYDPKKETFEFASTPAVTDLDNDGYQEVIVSTWTEKESKINGRLIILNYKGEMLKEITLPTSLGSKLTNGGLAKPLIADIDNDKEYEAVLNTTYSGIVAYNLPGSKVK